MRTKKQLTGVGGQTNDAVLATSLRFKQGSIPTVGEKKVYENGDEYIFCSSAIAISAGQVVAQGPATTPGVLANVSAGLSTVRVDVEYDKDTKAGGTLAILSGAGAGYTYPIVGNEIVDTAVTELTLGTPLVAGLATSDIVGLTCCKNTDVVIGTATGMNLGISQATVVDGEETFFWVQTKGVAFGQGVAAVGAVSVTAAGALHAVTGTEPIVGNCITIGPSNGMVVVDFRGQ